MKIEVDARQFRGMAGRYVKFSEELRRTKLEPFAKETASLVRVVARDHIPSDTLGKSLQERITYHSKGTRIVIYFPGADWNRLAYLLLVGAKPHPIRPRRRKAIFWEWVVGPTEETRTTRGAPNRKAKPLWSLEHPIPLVKEHPGFEGYDYLQAIVDDPLLQHRLSAGGNLGTMFANYLLVRAHPTEARFVGKGKRAGEYPKR